MFPLKMLVITDGHIFALGDFFIPVLVLIAAIAWGKTKSFSYALCVLIFGVYLLIITNEVFFPIVIMNTGEPHGYGMYSQLQLEANVNLIPFIFESSKVSRVLMRTHLLNILLTMPFGFGINFLKTIKPKRMILLVIVVGISLELTQLIISLLLGYFYRVIDINDVLMNTLGVILGYIVFRVFAWIYLWIMNRVNIPRWGIFGFTYDVAYRVNK